MARKPYFTIAKIFSGWEWNFYAVNGRCIASSVTAWDTKTKARQACHAFRRATKIAKVDIKEE